jgi:predicted nucleic acid-binding protein
VIFVDANVAMYAVGSDPLMAVRSHMLIGRISADGSAIVTSAEVLQEILHRYRAVGRVAHIQRAFDLVDGIVDEVLAVDRETIEEARDTLLARPELDARDCVHLATMARHGIHRIASFDRAFDQVPGIERLA